MRKVQCKHCRGHQVCIQAQRFSRRYQVSHYEALEYWFYCEQCGEGKHMPTEDQLYPPSCKVCGGTGVTDATPAEEQRLNEVFKPATEVLGLDQWGKRKNP